jgi:transcriptional regulator with XRE-family HTH domain
MLGKLSELRARRLNLGWTMLKLSQRCGVREARISLIERREIQGREDELNRIQQALREGEDAAR